ncbi:MAG: hypothetical protein CME63_12735 [Halobacteriovoraceae bacterium]|nr:hypothetical protein [Halobacteriovoraceae bacterium]|tara:strand:+ start:9573 stop:9941 length:369 start_codon:yes stop_codon:yes gene_type:complete
MKKLIIILSMSLSNLNLVYAVTCTFKVKYPDQEVKTYEHGDNTFRPTIQGTALTCYAEMGDYMKVQNIVGYNRWLVCTDPRSGFKAETILTIVASQKNDDTAVLSMFDSKGQPYMVTLNCSF